MLGTVTSLVGDLLQIEFTESLPEFDKNVDRWSKNIAPAGQKSTEDYEWRNQNLHDAKDYELDAWDGTKWYPSTILHTKKELVAPGREIEFVYVAFRVYRESSTTNKKMKYDQRGTFEGWSCKYDEYMPMFSPNTAPLGTKSGNSVVKPVQDDDEELDNYIQPSYGFERVYAVPRI